MVQPSESEELFKEPPPNAPEEPAQKEMSIHNSNNESLMDPEAEVQCMWEETHTKCHQEYDVGSFIRSGMEDQLQRLIKAVTGSFATTTQVI